MFKKRDKSIDMSVPKSYELYGVTVHKLPIAKYLAVLREITNLPADLVEKIYPEAKNFGEILDKLVVLDKQETAQLVGKLLTVVPVELCTVISNLLDIPQERLMDEQCENPLSLNELTEIIMAFWEINDMSDFLTTVSSLKARTRSQKMNTGSSDGSPAPKASE